MKTIVLFNHKGGVSKTTNVFYVGWMLAELGKTVLLVDADPQCNLTGLALTEGDFDKFEAFYKAEPDRNLMAGLRPVFEGQLAPLAAVPPVPIASRPGLFILPGHLQLSEYDVTLTLAHELTSSVQALKNVPGAFPALVQMTAASIAADFVIVDLNPSLSAINQNAVLSADHFIIPNSPDYFSLMAIRSLARVLPRWAAWHDSAVQHPVLKTATYSIRSGKPTFLGAIVQNFRLRGGAPTGGFQSRIDDLFSVIESKLVPALSACGMALPQTAHVNAIASGTSPYCLGLIPDFNTLKTTSEVGSTPVFALTDTQIGNTGVVLEQNQQKRQQFFDAYRAMAEAILAMV